MYFPTIPRIIPLDPPIERLLWTVRHVRREEAFPESHQEVSCKKITKEAYFKAVRIWDFIAPFFASRGYSPHTKDTKSDYLLPVPLPCVPICSIDSQELCRFLLGFE